MGNAETGPQQIWRQVTELIKKRIVQPTLWRAMESAIAVTIEDDEIVLGFQAGTFHMNGQLKTSMNQNAIERAIQEVSGRSLKMHVIDGITMDDWQNAKAREEEQRRLFDKQYNKQREQSALEGKWDHLLEIAQRRFATLPNRQFPQNKAIYLLEMVDIVAPEAQRLLEERKDLDDINQRQLARVVDKIAVLADAPPICVALELERAFLKIKK